MVRLFEVTVAAITYAAAGSPDVNFLAAEPKAMPKKLRLANIGTIGIYVSRDGTTDHDFIPATSSIVYPTIMDLGMDKLWFRLEAAGSAKIKVVEYP